MAKILLLDASMTGSTEIMADAVGDVVKAGDHELTRKSFDFDEIDVQELKEYDGVLIGTYSWDDYLPYEVEDFHDDLDQVDVSGTLFGLFGSCDSFYEFYGVALDALAEQIPEAGGSVFEKKLKIELEPDENDIKDCQQFANDFLAQVSEMK